MDEQLIALYHRHVAAAYDRQMRLADFIERAAPGENWHYQTSTATLRFGSQVTFAAHDLGSHADPDNSWMWVWCNPHLNLTPANREVADAVQRMGQERDIPAFTATGYFDVGPILGDQLSGIAAHVFGIVVGGELGYHAYYTMPFANGRFTVLLRDDRLRCDEPYPLVRISSVFPQTLTSYPVLNHRTAFLGYLDWYGYTPEVEGQSVRVVEDGEEVMRAEFDELNRMTNLTGRLRGQR
jgi:hypothetical protein